MIAKAIKLARTAARHALRPVRPFLDDFLRHVSGVIHVGANSGQERELYDELGLDVVWVEAIPGIFKQLEKNIAPYPRQRALNRVLTDGDDEWLEFNVASNDGLSSSILDLKDHKELHPHIGYTGKLRLQSQTFATMVSEQDIDLSRYPALVIDVQGAELMVLRGAGDLIRNFQYIKAEAADGEPYANCCTAAELIDYLGEFGFRVQRKVVIGVGPTGDKYYDIVFKRPR